MSDHLPLTKDSHQHESKSGDHCGLQFKYETHKDRNK